MPVPLPKLPQGNHVKVAHDPTGGFCIVTAFMGLGVGSYLGFPTTNLAYASAKVAFEKWETFCEANQPKKKGKKK